MNRNINTLDNLKQLETLRNSNLLNTNLNTKINKEKGGSMPSVLDTKQNCGNSC